MTTTAWAHLPNAAHIDRMLASVRKNPERWSTARDAAWAAARDAAWDVARGAVWDAARAAAWAAAGGAAWDAVGGAARDEAWKTARYGAWNAARDAVLALLAWDDCAYILELPEDALKVLRAVGNEQAILLSTAAHALRETS